MGINRMGILNEAGKKNGYIRWVPEAPLKPVKKKKKIAVVTDPEPTDMDDDGYSNCSGSFFGVSSRMIPLGNGGFKK